ncbi:MAG: imidazole glycerol phosphate synthase cyclase subunit [Myxococcales bacterium]
MTPPDTATNVRSHARRIIARLDIKGPNLVKGIQLEGLRVMGNPAEHALRYYAEGADELIYMDIVASLYERNNLVDVVERTASQIFVPLTVGGGIRSLKDITTLLRAGADKVAINTAAIRRPELLREASHLFGSQCIVLSIEAKRQPGGHWEAYTDNGRERTGLDAVEWAKRAIDLGAGELMLTSVDREGTKKGFDIDLVRQLGPVLGVPVIASGGAGTIGHISDVLKAGADAVAVAGLLHYRTETVGSLKQGLREYGWEVRQ